MLRRVGPVGVQKSQEIAAGGIEAGGKILLRINTTGGGVDETITLKGSTIVIRFGEAEGDLFHVSLSDLELNIADFVTIVGNVSFTTVAERSVFAGSGLEIFLGEGPARLENGALNPLARGVLLSDAMIGLIEFTGGDTTTYALHATGTVQLLGFNGITLGGTATVR